MTDFPALSSSVHQKLLAGCVIPAHPLALTQDLRLDERRQRALTRYYLDAGAGGLAVGVHTTQFQIHDPKVGLYRPVLELARRTVEERKSAGEPPILVAGIVGKTPQAVREAEMAAGLGYHLGLLSLTAVKGAGVDELIDHARAVARVIPLMGFYLQQTISGMVLPGEFWRRLAEMPNVMGIKIAPFNRYQTLDVLEAVAASCRHDQIALYTGNDDNILVDLLTDFEFSVGGQTRRLHFAGGLLGHWACWTKRAVEQFSQIQNVRKAGKGISAELLTLAQQVTLSNAALFDADNRFAGCIAGISYALQRQGLLANTCTLDPHERLSPGQAEKIDRIARDYPHLLDDEFIREHLSQWLRD